MSSGVIWLGQFRFHDFSTGDSEEKTILRKSNNFWCLLVKEPKRHTRKIQVCAYHDLHQYPIKQRLKGFFVTQIFTFNWCFN
jgi:hypothetical protein